MPTFISLFNFTAQGAQKMRETARRADAFTKSAKAAGVAVTAVYWTLGAYDGVLLFEAEDDEAAAAAMMSLAIKGNVRSQTMRAFTRDEIGAVLSRVK